MVSDSANHSVDNVSDLMDNAPAQNDAVEEVASFKGTETIDSESSTSSRPKLSQEEIQRQADLLHEQLHKKRVEREKKEEIERIRTHMVEMKALVEQNALLEQERKNREMQQVIKEKEEHQIERQRQQQLMRNEYRERFGCEMPETEKTVVKDVRYWCNYIRKENQSTPGFNDCLTILDKYFTNAKNNLLDKKYHRIRKNNSKFLSCVLPFKGVEELLEATGFQFDGSEFYCINGTPNVNLLGDAIKYINTIKRLR